MQKMLYNEFDEIIAESLAAADHIQQNFHQLMNRKVAHILYGPYVYGPGIAMPSRIITKDKERKLSAVRRRKRCVVYYFDEDWDVLYNRAYDGERLVSTILHCWIGDTNYARYFLGDTDAFYTETVFSVKYKDNIAVRCALAWKSRLFVEYLKQDLQTRKTAYTWYNYYPYRKEIPVGTSSAPQNKFGERSSPVMTETGVYELVDMDFSKWDHA